MGRSRPRISPGSRCRSGCGNDVLAMLIRRTARLVPGLLIAICPCFVPAQTYPVKSLRIITAEPGGGADYVARIIAKGLGEAYAQQVIVDNRRGAGGIIAIDAAAKAAHDGYTLLVYNNSMWILSLIKKLPYDPVSDFSPIASIVSMPNVLVVHPSLPVKSVKEFVSLAQSRGGELSYASAGSGSTGHLAAELFKAMANVKMVHISYKGSASALNDLIGGQVQVMFPNAAAVMQHVKNGRLKALGVTSPGPSRLFPDYPTVASSGLPGYQSVVTFGLFVPANTPAALINQLNQAVARILAKPDVKERFTNVGAETVGGNPEQLADTIKADIARLGPVIRNAGIREE